MRAQWPRSGRPPQHVGVGSAPPDAAGARSRLSAGVIAVLTAVSLFAVNGTVTKSLLRESISPRELVTLRCLGAAAVYLAVVALRREVGHLTGPLRRPRELRFVIVYGLTGVAAVQGFFLASIARIPISVTLLFEMTAAVPVALWLWVRRGAVPRVRLVGALGACSSK